MAKIALQADRRRRRVDLVVDDLERARAERLRAVALQRLDDERRPAALRRRDARQVVLRQREEHRDRIELRDDDDARRVGGVHDVARVDLAHARDAVDGRLDARVVELQLRVLDLRLVALHGAAQLLDGRALVVDLLLRDELLRDDGLVALEVALRAAQLRRVARERRLGLVQLDVERPRIDLREQLAAA